MVQVSVDVGALRTDDDRIAFDGDGAAELTEVARCDVAGGKFRCLSPTAAHLREHVGCALDVVVKPRTNYHRLIGYGHRIAKKMIVGRRI